MISASPSRSSHGEQERRGDLIVNLTRFSRLLREHGVPVVLDSEISAASALLHIDLLDPEEFYLTLKTTLLSRKKDEEAFDDLFRRFWRGLGRTDVRPQAKSRNDQAGAPTLGTRRGLAAARDDAEDGEGPENEQRALDGLIPGYSPEELLRKKSFPSPSET